MNDLGLEDCSEEEKQVWRERAKTLLNDDPDLTESRIAELRSLVKNERGLSVPEDQSFYLKFLRAGLSDPKDAFNIIKNFFGLKSKKYFEVFCHNVKAKPTETISVFNQLWENCCDDF